MKLRGKRVFISGAGSGFGRELALQLSLEKGSHVLAADINAQALEILSSDISKYDGLVSTVQLDMRNTSNIRTFIHQQFPATPIDIWINNAGIVDVGLFHEQSLESLESMIDINLKSYVLSCRLILEFMETHGKGLIVNIGSLAGEVPGPYISAYSATKFAVTGLSLSLQEELRQRDSCVQILLVNPGFARTALNDSHIPEWFNPALTTPKSVAQEVISAIEQDQKYIAPGWNARFMKLAYSRFPTLTLRMSKLLLLKKPWHLLMNRFDLPSQRNTNKTEDP